MILHISYEELKALQAGGRSLLEGAYDGSASVLAPSEGRARVEALLPMLDGDLSLTTLAEVRSTLRTVEDILARLRADMESAVVATHAADEHAVACYFDFAHGLTVAHRLRDTVSEMEALIELVTGRPADDETARTFRFPT